MNQTVDARDNLRKSAERRHGDNLDRADRTDRIILLHDFPRVVLGLFEAKRNFIKNELKKGVFANVCI